MTAKILYELAAFLGVQQTPLRSGIDGHTVFPKNKTL